MLLTEREIRTSARNNKGSLLANLRDSVHSKLSPDEIPVRFVVTNGDSNEFSCEIGVLSGLDASHHYKPESIFDFAKREIENTKQFNAVMLVPTGIGAEIGGHAGDATPAARLLAAVCDTLITHPNVANASDINELPENALYVEGSIISRLFMGTVGLQPVRSNRVLLVIDGHKDNRISDLAVNAVSAARVTLGIESIGVIKVDPPIDMRADYSPSGRAVGQIEYLERLLSVVTDHRSEFDALALASKIGISEGLYREYFQSEGEIINPWGGVEAMLTHTISALFNVPSAHSPMAEDMNEANEVFGIVDPRMAAEAVSSAFLHCVLKGLHRSPRIITDRMLFSHPEVLTAADISCLVIPDKCVGLPTLAAIEQGIPVIAVRENHNHMKNDLRTLPFAPGKLFIVDNYLEAVGVMTALKAGVSISSVRRPLESTKVFTEHAESIPATSDSSSISASSKK